MNTGCQNGNEVFEATFTISNISTLPKRPRYIWGDKSSQEDHVNVVQGRHSFHNETSDSNGNKFADDNAELYLIFSCMIVLKAYGHV